MVPLTRTDALLTLGDAGDFRAAWPDYIHSLGLSDADVPELIRMATDTALHAANEPEGWAPVHAWRALGQLRAADAIAPLLSILHTLPDDDYANEEIPRVLGLMGEPALEPLAAYLADASRGLFPRAGASEALVAVGRASASLRGAAIEIMARQLADRSDASLDLNSFIVANLVDLDAVEVAPVIAQAFADDVVEWEVCGDWEDVQVALGLISVRTTPRPFYAPRPGSELVGAHGPRDDAPPAAGTPHKSTASRKKTKKRNRMAKASRRRNRRKK